MIMTETEYIDNYLESEEWKKLEEIILVIHDCCEKCGSYLRLNIYHKNLDSIGRERIDDVGVICSKCSKEDKKPVAVKNVI